MAPTLFASVLRRQVAGHFRAKVTLFGQVSGSDWSPGIVRKKPVTHSIFSYALHMLLCPVLPEQVPAGSLGAYWLEPRVIRRTKRGDHYGQFHLFSHLGQRTGDPNLRSVTGHDEWVNPESGNRRRTDEGESQVRAGRWRTHVAFNGRRP
jgi:hypothetical protein